MEAGTLQNVSTAAPLPAAVRRSFACRHTSAWVPPALGPLCPHTEPSPRSLLIRRTHRRLPQVITFPPEGAFIVDSGIAAEGPQRTAFQFSAATLRLPKGRRLALPPFGKVRPAAWGCSGRPARPLEAGRGGVLAALPRCTRPTAMLCPACSPPTCQPCACHRSLARQGWFDTVYCDDSIRVAQDSRGDTLVVQRDGPPHRFE